MREKKVKQTMTVLCAAALLTGLTGCAGKEPLEYEMTIQGTAQASGVVSYLGYEMNVYQDEASNSCGDCADQPVHLYVGATADEAARAVAEAVTRADDLWEVKAVEGETVVLKEKEPGTVKKGEIPEPEVPFGMTVSDNYGHTYTGTKEAQADGQKKTIYDLDGEELRVPVTPQRLAAVYGPSYEALVVLGQEEKIVVCADVQKDNFPWASEIFSRLEELPCLENVHSSVNMEEMMVYKPDLVFAFSRPNELKQLQEAGISAVPGTTTKKLSDVPKQLMVYARSLGNGAVERAEAYDSYFQEKYNAVIRKTSGLPEEKRPKVYYAGIDLLTTYGSYSDIPELIEAAGGTAVTKDVQAGNHTQINFEQLAAWNPDYIFIDHGGINDGETVEMIKEEAEKDSQYSKIHAVLKGQIYLSPSGVFYWDMGLQKILLLEYVAKTIHPELFSDLDMKQEIIEFYEKFYGYELTEDQANAILNRQNP